MSNMSNYEREHYMREQRLLSEIFRIDRNRRINTNIMPSDLATIVEMEEKVPGMEWWYRFLERISQ